MMESLTKVTRHGQITLPANVRKLLNIEEGDLIEIQVVDDQAILTPKKLIDKSQAYFWTKEWQEAERQADEDIKAGRVKRFASVEALVRDLEGIPATIGDVLWTYCAQKLRHPDDNEDEMQRIRSLGSEYKLSQATPPKLVPRLIARLSDLTETTRTIATYFHWTLRELSPNEIDELHVRLPGDDKDMMVKVAAPAWEAYLKHPSNTAERKAYSALLKELETGETLLPVIVTGPWDKSITRDGKHRLLACYQLGREVMVYWGE